MATQRSQDGNIAMKRQHRILFRDREQLWRRKQQRGTGLAASTISQKAKRMIVGNSNKIASKPPTASCGPPAGLGPKRTVLGVSTTEHKYATTCRRSALAEICLWRFGHTLSELPESMLRDLAGPGGVAPVLIEGATRCPDLYGLRPTRQLELRQLSAFICEYLPDSRRLDRTREGRRIA